VSKDASSDRRAIPGGVATAATSGATQPAGGGADAGATSATRARYDRVAPVYDMLEAVLERLVFRRLRRRLWAAVPPGRVLEVGVGTGKNMPYYPQGSTVTAIDLSPRMLARARAKARRDGVNVQLIEMDAQALRFADDAFEAAAAAFVFCSVPDPVLGLRELARVVKPGRRVVLLEHVRVTAAPIGRVMDAFDPLVAWLTGVHINRPTADNVVRAGLEVESTTALAPLGLVQLIVARVP